MQETEIIAKTEGLQVRIMILASREIAAWHYHTRVTDDIFCLSGKIIVRMKKFTSPREKGFGLNLAESTSLRTWKRQNPLICWYKALANMTLMLLPNWIKQP